MITDAEVERIPGSTVYGSDGEKIGKAGAVYRDDQTGRPEWMTVQTGLFGTSESFVPLADADLDGDDVRVPFEKSKVKDAPRVDSEGHLDISEEDRLFEHYGVGGVDGAGGSPSGSAEEGTRAAAAAAQDRDRGYSDSSRDEHRDGDRRDAPAAAHADDRTGAPSGDDWRDGRSEERDGFRAQDDRDGWRADDRDRDDRGSSAGPAAAVGAGGLAAAAAAATRSNDDHRRDDRSNDRYGTDRADDRRDRSDDGSFRGASSVRRDEAPSYDRDATPSLRRDEGFREDRSRDDRSRERSDSGLSGSPVAAAGAGAVAGAAPGAAHRDDRSHDDRSREDRSRDDVRDGHAGQDSSERRPRLSQWVLVRREDVIEIDAAEAERLAAAKGGLR